MQELAEELAKTQLEIVAVQETRWSGTGLINKKTFHFTTVDLKTKQVKQALAVSSSGEPQMS
jgi:hypothetical protein